MDRFYIEQINCPYCQELKSIVEDINILLSPEKRIRIIDATWDWGFGINLNPILNYVDIDATPSVYLDGNVYQGFTSREHLRGFLMGYLETIGDIKRKYFDEYSD